MIDSDPARTRPAPWDYAAPWGARGYITDLDGPVHWIEFISEDHGQDQDQAKTAAPARARTRTRTAAPARTTPPARTTAPASSRLSCSCTAWAART